MDDHNLEEVSRPELEQYCLEMRQFCEELQQRLRETTEANRINLCTASSWGHTPRSRLLELYSLNLVL